MELSKGVVTHAIPTPIPRKITLVSVPPFAQTSPAYLTKGMTAAHAPAPARSETTSFWVDDIFLFFVLYLEQADFSHEIEPMIAAALLFTSFVSAEALPTLKFPGFAWAENLVFDGKVRYFLTFPNSQLREASRAISSSLKLFGENFGEFIYVMMGKLIVEIFITSPKISSNLVDLTSPQVVTFCTRG
jgi:hypothetical protein